MRKIFIHHIGFRLLAPVFVGVMVYVLILMVFDSISLLIENFFSQEAAFCIGLTYVLHEFLRGVFILLDKRFPLHEKPVVRTFGYIVSALFVSVSVVSGGLWAYYHAVVGFDMAVIEMLTFNGLYALFT